MGNRVCFKYLLGLWLAGAVPCLAVETDNFTLPPQDWTDVSDLLEAKVRSVVETAVARFNDGKLDIPVAVMPLHEQLAWFVYDELGKGLPWSRIEDFLYEDESKLFFPGPGKRFYDHVGSVYENAPWTSAPVLWMAPNIRLYGVFLGTDKIGHFFQEGYKFFNNYLAEKARPGQDPNESESDREERALAKARAASTSEEDWFYGKVTTGVASNGDLSANYAGYKFYRNLLLSVQKNEEAIAPIILQEGPGLLRLNPERSHLLQPFITEHLNEAWNPSVLKDELVEPVRSEVKKRCASWRERYRDFPADYFKTQYFKLQNWFGEPYGAIGTDPLGVCDHKICIWQDCF